MVEISAKYLDLEGKTRFLVGNGNQTNYVTGGEKAFTFKNSQGEAVEFKKTGFILNVLPYFNPKGARPSRCSFRWSSPARARACRSPATASRTSPLGNGRRRCPE
jgi:hypothetical protein